MPIEKKFVGFGFGPIQSGLMLYEAIRSGNFAAYTIAEVDPALVEAVRNNDHKVRLNIAHAEGIESTEISGFDIRNPSDPADRQALAEAISRADELATAIPSVDLYDAGGPNSIAALLAENLNQAKPQILYASENNNFAARILRNRILKHAPSRHLQRFQILDTVVGKMSGVIADQDSLATLGLQPFTPHAHKAILVEEFNRIFVSRVILPDVKRGITVFEEKDDLLPFEEAKLFGHNAIHSILGYLAHRKGYRTMSAIRKDSALMELGRRAFLDESGAALIRKHGALGDPLFTPAGYREYAEDLLRRMTNPWLHDEVARICRDPRRKLSYADRIFGTMREALRQGVEPRLMARGAYAALCYHAEQTGTPLHALPAPQRARTIQTLLTELWVHDSSDELRDRCMALVQETATQVQ